MDAFIKKALLWAWVSFFGGIVSDYIGGWDDSVKTLVTLMAIDFITGLMIAAFWKKSPKSEDGALQSKESFRGLARKVLIFLFVIVAHRLDMINNSTYIRDAVVIGFCGNELISITENAGIMGLPIPEVIKNMISVLKNKEIPNDNDQH